MIKKLLISYVCLPLFGFTSHAQNLEAVMDTLKFGTTTELAPVITDLRVFNPGLASLEVTDIDFFELYAEPPFLLSDTAFTVAPGDTHTVQIQFLPEHNIDHKMALVVKSNGGLGSIPVALVGQGTYSRPYYGSTQNKVEQALKAALKTKTGQGYNSLGYNTARDNMFMLIDNKKTNGQGAGVNTLECIYTGTVITGYNSRSAAQNGNPQFNTEHTFPQGKFNSNEPMKSDLHHLFPTTNTSNSQRGNDPFGVVTSSSWSAGGSKSGGGKFEPRDVQKGPTARAMMYFVMRYQDHGNFFQSQETVLRAWHLQYPPDSVEIRRNAAIDNLQGNRNPFVDYPQFAERITSLVSNAGPAPIKKLYSSADTINVAQGQGRYTYGYVIYNDGNTPLNLGTFSLSDTSLKFIGGNPGSITLPPQTFHKLSISFNASIAYQATLNYTVDITSQPNMSVPIRGGRSIGLRESLAIDALIVYPNPANGIVHLSVEGKTITKVWLVNVAGQKKEVQILGSNQLDVSHEPPGLYTVTVLRKAGDLRSCKVLVQ